jgi:hypothetical protein
MSGRGRPLRFLGLVVAGWIGMRVVLLWPADALPDPVQVAAKPVAKSIAAAPVAAAAAPEPTTIRPNPVAVAAPRFDPLAVDPARVRFALLNMLRFGEVQYADMPLETVPGRFTPFVQLPPLGGQQRRWSGSAWLVARPGQGLGAAPGGQLGGSQLGVRLAWLLDPDKRIVAYARFTAPLAGPGREAAVGIEWQPGNLPARLLVEQRFGLDGNRGGTGIGVIAGIDADLAPGFRLETYGQAGMILRGRLDPYADGAARATGQVASAGGTRLGLGGGAWGAAQRDAARLDVGPSATLSVPVAGQRIRVALDWRERVAGDARPGSGVALSLGSDF